MVSLVQLCFCCRPVLPGRRDYWSRRCQSARWASLRRAGGTWPGRAQRGMASWRPPYLACEVGQSLSEAKVGARLTSGIFHLSVAKAKSSVARLAVGATPQQWNTDCSTPRGAKSSAARLAGEATPRQCSFEGYLKNFSERSGEKFFRGV